jgi:ABC-2 type transport system ATP-binding protein
MEEAETLCDRIAIMDRGKIVAMDTPRELIGQLTEEGSIECSLGDELPSDVLDGLGGVVHQERLEQTVVLRSVDLNGTLVALLRLLTARGLPLNSLQVRTPTLEDVFLSLTGHRLRN